ncbi:MAG: restriction endonuclease subunit S [Candidatus Acidiferrales bacterium]
MARLRHLSGRKWNTPPVLTAARRILIEALRGHITSKPLGEMAEFVNGTSYRSDLLVEEGTPIIRISNITDPKSDFLKTKESFEDKYKVEIGDLLVSWSASFKSIIWPGPPSILNQHIFRVRERSPNNRSFIRHAIEAVFDEMQQKVVGIGMMHLRRQDFIGHEIPCPSPEIQQAVSAYLDWIESGNDGKEPSLPKLLEQQRRIIARIEELTAKINEARILRNASSSESEALIASETKASLDTAETHGWPVVLLGDVTEIRSGVTLGRQLRGSTIRLPYLRVANVQDGRLDLSVIKEVEILPLEIEKWQLMSGDVLLTEGGDWDKLGRGTVWRGEIPNCIHQNHIFRVRANPNEFDPDFIAAIIGSPYGKAYFQAASKQTTNLASINQRQLKSFRLFRPPLEEQRRFVARSNAFRAKIRTLNRFQSETTVELDALMPSILSKAFRGEL